MNKSMSIFALALSFLSLSQVSIAEDTTMGSSTLGAGYTGHFDKGEELDEVDLKWGMGQGRRHFVQVKVKVHDDGELALDQLQWSAYTVYNNVENLGVRVDARVLGFYLEEVHQTLGNEMGLELIDLKVNKVFKVEEGDDVSYILDAYVTIDKPWYVDTNDNNKFINQNLENVENTENVDLKHFRNNDYIMSYGAEAKVRYETNSGYMEAGAFYKDHSDRQFKNDRDDRYDYSKSSRGFQVVIKPNKKKCHKYTAGLRQVEFNQTFNDVNSGSTRDNQIYVSYECNIDLVELIYGSSDNQIIRH
jgi:hypothetical protein